MTRIDEIRDRAAKATAGPWEANEYYSSIYSHAENLKSGRVFGYGYGNNGFICDLNDGEYHEYSALDEEKANADFIAHSREDIPFLLGEIDKLRAELSDPLTVRLPCKVGDTVYRPEALQYSWDIVSIIIYPDELLFIDDSENSFTADDIGKTVFLSREEAEKEATE